MARPRSRLTVSCQGRFRTCRYHDLARVRPPARGCDGRRGRCKLPQSCKVHGATRVGGGGNARVRKMTRCIVGLRMHSCCSSCTGTPSIPIHFALEKNPKTKNQKQRKNCIEGAQPLAIMQPSCQLEMLVEPQSPPIIRVHRVRFFSQNHHFEAATPHPQPYKGPRPL